MKTSNSRFSQGHNLLKLSYQEKEKQMNSIFGITIYCLRSRYHVSPVCLVVQFFLDEYSPHIACILQTIKVFITYWFLPLLCLFSIWSTENFSYVLYICLSSFYLMLSFSFLQTHCGLIILSTLYMKRDYLLLVSASLLTIQFQKP